MPRETLTSWGRILHVEQEVASLASRFDTLPIAPDSALTMLPYGAGRSYGDSCLNAGGIALKTGTLNRFIAFNPDTGILSCEAGVLLSEILQLIVAQGWFLPVTPGTRFVSLGGAIANDVHGKNHHKTGTFGRHVRRIELLRSDGQRLICSADENTDLFAATIGGLGLTGLIVWAEIQLRRIGNPWINTETIRFETLAEFFDLCDASDRDYEYTVSWIDCTGNKQHRVRGLFTRGDHAPAIIAPDNYTAKTRTFPFVPPLSMVNSQTTKAFNAVYYHKQRPRESWKIQHYEPFFYPLDGVLKWNRMYGPSGFYQYQCVIPIAAAREAMAELLEQVAQSSMGSFLAVLKICGDIPSPGMLSFPLPGLSLALDFPNRKEVLLRLFARLDRVVSNAGGRLYPAKDGRMPGSLFRNGYPRWQEFTHHMDPRFSSSFWRRVMEDT
jgi:FAD/FMN-containing dehydrogenase